MGFLKNLINSIAHNDDQESDNDWLKRIGQQVQSDLDADREDVEDDEDDDDCDCCEERSYRIAFTSSKLGGGQSEYIKTNCEITSDDEAKTALVQYLRKKNPDMLSMIGQITIEDYMEW